MVEQVERGTEAHVDRKAIADDFAERMNGKMERAKIDAAVQKIQSTTTAYKAHGSVVSMVFYFQCQVVIEGNKTFDGKGGGGMTPGAGALFGTVYTDDLNRLLNSTHSFAAELTPVYGTVQFFDSNHNFLGHFQSGGISTVTGAGGGTGSWS